MTTWRLFEFSPARAAELGVTFASCNYQDGSGILAGAPSALAALCAGLGFANPCKRGRIYLTGAKMRRLGLVTTMEGENRPAPATNQRSST